MCGRTCTKIVCPAKGIGSHPSCTTSQTHLGQSRCLCRSLSKSLSFLLTHDLVRFGSIREVWTVRRCGSLSFALWVSAIQQQNTTPVPATFSLQCRKLKMQAQPRRNSSTGMCSCRCVCDVRRILFCSTPRTQLSGGKKKKSMNQSRRRS